MRGIPPTPGQANRFLGGMAFSAADGEMSFNGLRYMLIRPETLVRFQKAVDREIGPRTADLMASAVREVGESIGDRYRAAGRAPAEALQSMAASAAELGWASFEVRGCAEPGGMISVTATNSAFAQAYGSSASPVCHVIRGLFAGAISRLVGNVERASEIRCACTGEPACEFEFLVGLQD
jgi:predicted hydrocarbon binding protein